MRHILHTPSLLLLSSHSCDTFILLGRDESNIALSQFSAYLCLTRVICYARIKLTVDNSERRVQVVCH